MAIDPSANRRANIYNAIRRASSVGRYRRRQDILIFGSVDERPRRALTGFEQLLRMTYDVRVGIGRHSLGEVTPLSLLCNIVVVVVVVGQTVTSHENV